MVEQARSVPAYGFSAAIFAAVAGLGLVAAGRSSGPPGVRFVTMISCLVASVVVQVVAYHLGSPVRWWLVWLALAAVLVQLRRRNEIGAQHRAPVRWIERGVAGVMIVALVLLLAAPVGQALDYLPRVDRQSRAEGPEESGSQPYWGFGEELDTSVRGDLSDREVLRVRSEVPTYWRASTYDTWDGRVWTQSGTVEADVFPTRTAWRWLEQRVDVRQPIGSVVIGAPQIAQVEGVDARPGSDGGWQVATPIGPGTTYDVTSAMILPDREILRSLDPSTAELPRSIDDFRNSLPSTDRVRALAHETTAGAATDYDRITALIGWIEANIEYDRDSPVPPPGADAVDAFLFEDRVGFCEQIASSLVVMARELDMPARLAVGFVPGEREGRRTWISKGTDAHAWVEVFFPEMGWVAFDPTTDVPLAGEFDGGLDLLALLIRVAVAALVVAVVVGVWLVLRGRSAPATTPGVATLIARFSAVGDRRPSETLREYGDRLEAELGDDRPPPLARMFEAASYRVPPEPVDVDRVNASIASLERSVRGDRHDATSDASQSMG